MDVVWGFLDCIREMGIAEALYTGYVGMMGAIEIPRAFLLMPGMQLLCAPWHRL